MNKHQTCMLINYNISHNFKIMMYVLVGFFGRVRINGGYKSTKFHGGHTYPNSWFCFSSSIFSLYHIDHL
uniref:Uncharacterized protein n=1 Tax=Aegilops tauschii subsp. strangulata TaxID=200361 RepID=A0A453K5S7_AEGTS